ncbi:MULTISPECIES: hypothetical protein [Polaribacter]|jgi:hypothetical protein|uniref:Uncharacterized protein n=1 Tax=Polaribacter dokdonensis DSW-5 TaxID=1300348 RepID=A0A0M9CI95_9FLAO|nr:MULTISPECIES: hypothetical protein [Polaribacter]KOY53082.1 hypothetical protein I602_2642 [Polaribacter dokdonensis DSW-5]UAM98920.1 hypothetical protein K8354_03620 [Polaribacter litorisediminis]SEE56924.1 hypothetical protein SAMN05444353_2417 [Polaribacter dokdonensis DSW-5]|tara:strand:+ start:7041 stop:7214 length:174 start_codon:yes stop_codon:yes gene_type:complete
MRTDLHLKVGTASGTLLSISPGIFTQDILKTIILAVIGATVSFMVSYSLKKITKRKK